MLPVFSLKCLECTLVLVGSFAAVLVQDFDVRPAFWLSLSVGAVVAFLEGTEGAVDDIDVPLHDAQSKASERVSHSL